MQNMVFDLIKFFTIMISIYIIFFFVIKPTIDKKIKLKSMEIENYKMDLLMKLDPVLAENAIDELVKKYLAEYVLTNFIINSINYIRKEQIEKMVRDLTKKISIEISELYVFYIKTLTNIKSDDDLIGYVYKKVKEHTVNYVTEFNKPKEEIKN